MSGEQPSIQIAPCSQFSAQNSQRRRNSLPIWSCSVWGLPCPRHYCSGGALLPHLFTLTPALPPWRCVFCGTFRQPGLNPASRTLSGTLLCGVRTFLSPRPRSFERKTQKATVRSGCLRNHYIGGWAEDPGRQASDLRRRTSDLCPWVAHGRGWFFRPYCQAQTMSCRGIRW